MTAPICLTCGTAARLTDGRDIYSHRPDLADKPIWACTVCENLSDGSVQPLLFDDHPDLTPAE